MESPFDIPVVLVFFNRIEPTKVLFQRISELKPTTLYLISDGAREQIPGEKERVEQVRELFEELPWECDVHKNYASQNMGCDKRIESGLDWVFETEKTAIILEDDCIPDLSLFPFCKELLERYALDDKVKYIAGSNQIDTFKISDSYLFTYSAWTWGWATWKRAWRQRVNVEVQWDTIKDKILHFSMWSLEERVNFQKTIEKHIQEGQIPWDYCWGISVLLNKGLSIVPKTNLISNIGFTMDATHTSSGMPGYNPQTIPMEFPLVHPDSITERVGYHKAAYDWNRQKIWQKLIEPDFYRRQWKRLFGK